MVSDTNGQGGGTGGRLTDGQGLSAEAWKTFREAVKPLVGELRWNQAGERLLGSRAGQVLEAIGPELCGLIGGMMIWRRSIRWGLSMVRVMQRECTEKSGLFFWGCATGRDARMAWAEVQDGQGMVVWLSEELCMKLLEVMVVLGARGLEVDDAWSYAGMLGLRHEDQEDMEEFDQEEGKEGNQPWEACEQELL